MRRSDDRNVVVEEFTIGFGRTGYICLKDETEGVKVSKLVAGREIVL